MRVGWGGKSGAKAEGDRRWGSGLVSKPRVVPQEEQVGPELVANMT